MKNNLKTPLLKVGIIGYSAQSFDVDMARMMIINRFQKLIQVHGSNIKIISGLTWMVIPGLAYEVATGLNLKTVGIACSKAFDYKVFPCHRTIIVGSQWGDESERFLESINLLIRIGGGNSLLENASWLKMQEYRLKNSTWQLSDRSLGINLN